jgi:hypothetical protein
MNAGTTNLILLVIVPLAGIVLVLSAVVGHRAHASWSVPRVVRTLWALSFGIPALLILLTYRGVVTRGLPGAHAYAPLALGIVCALVALVSARGWLRLLCAGVLLLQTAFTFLALLLMTIARYGD